MLEGCCFDWSHASSSERSITVTSYSHPFCPFIACAAGHSADSGSSETRQAIHLVVWVGLCWHLPFLNSTFKLLRCCRQIGAFTDLLVHLSLSLNPYSTSSCHLLISWAIPAQTSTTNGSTPPWAHHCCWPLSYWRSRTGSHLTLLASVARVGVLATFPLEALWFLRTVSYTYQSYLQADISASHSPWPIARTIRY